MSSIPCPMIFPSALPQEPLMYAYQLKDLGALGFIPCCASRHLLRFPPGTLNVKVSAVHGYFEGLPCPTTGVIVAAYVLSGIKIWNWLAMLCVLALAFLMVSEIHYPDNKGRSSRSASPAAPSWMPGFFLSARLFTGLHGQPFSAQLTLFSVLSIHTSTVARLRENSAV